MATYTLETGFKVPGVCRFLILIKKIKKSNSK